MAVSVFLIKKWYKMLTGKSYLHVNQDLGRCFKKNKIRGYYNNMTEKVTMLPELLENDDLPKLYLEDGGFTYFPVAIFQYGLGAYDLYLQTKEEKYLRKFMQCADWAMEHQDDMGRWNNFSHFSPEHPYGAMAQGEGASLLVRAYEHTKEAKYLNAAEEAVLFMLMPLEKGGTLYMWADQAYLMEYTFLDVVLNGFIFAWWGLYDFVLAKHDKGLYWLCMDRTLKSMVHILPEFKCSYWSMYSRDGKIASPFYHNLHIAQMQAMYQLTGKEIFDEYAKLWQRQQKNIFCKSIAFIRKAVQKILE